ncbi:MAG: BatD family protein [Phycisphaerae bacterium]|nr:BatD family protein [Phycisphaerae bacterium]
MFCLSVATLAQVAAAQVTVAAQVDTSKPIYEGEQFAYYVIIEGDNKPGTVDLEPLAAYRPAAMDGQSSTLNFNGRVTHRYIMQFALSAPEAGLLRLPPLKVTVNGKVYTTNGVNVSVTKPGSTEKIDVEVELPVTQCYLGEPVPVTVRWFVWLSEARGMGQVVFNVPFLNSDRFLVEDADDTAVGQETTMINGQPVRLHQRQVKHNGVDSLEVSFTKILIPRKTGAVQIEPVTVSANLTVGYTRGVWGSERKYDRFVTRSEPLALGVLPLPQEGRPADFSGLVGRYTIAASASPTSVNVGDPITLTVRVGGSRFLKSVQQPDLASVAGFADDFKMSTERDRGTVEGGFKIFRQMLRARHDKVSVIPPIPLCYFDAEKGKYVTIHSEAIKLEVAATRVVTEADLEGSDFIRFGRSVEAAQTGLSAHFEGLEALKDQSFSPLAALIAPGYVLLWGGPLMMLVVSGIVKVSTHNTPEKIAAARRRAALKNGIRAAKRAGRRSGSEACRMFAAAMKQYAADKFNRSARSLTAQDCCELLGEATVDPDAAAAFGHMIERCETATYSGAEIQEAVDACSVIELMRTVDRGLR